MAKALQYSFAWESSGCGRSYSQVFREWQEIQLVGGADGTTRCTNEGCVVVLLLWLVWCPEDRQHNFDVNVSVIIEYRVCIWKQWILARHTHIYCILFLIQGHLQFFCLRSCEFWWNWVFVLDCCIFMEKIPIFILG